MLQNFIIQKLSNIGLVTIGSQLRLKCKICTTDDIGDEYHYLFTCDFFKSDRKLYLKPYFYVKPNICKYRELFTLTNEATLIKLSKFVAIIFEKFSV